MENVRAENLKAIVDGAVRELADILSDDQIDRVAKVIESATIRGMLEGQHRAVDVCNERPEAERDLAYKIATAIRQKNDALIANLTSLR